MENECIVCAIIRSDIALNRRLWETNKFIQSIHTALNRFVYSGASVATYALLVMTPERNIPHIVANIEITTDGRKMSEIVIRYMAR